MKKWRKVIPVIALALISTVVTGCTGKDPVNETDPGKSDAGVYSAESNTSQEQNTELVNPWEYDLTVEEVKEQTGCEFIVPEGAHDVAFAANQADGIAEMDFTMDEVKYNARMKATEDYEDISGAFYEWDAEGVDEVGNAMADVRIYTPDNVCNVIWHEDGMMYSLFTIGAGDTETVKTANLVFAGGGSRSQDNEEADNTEKPLTDISLGTSGFIISIPSDYYNGEVTKDDRKDDQIAYYKSDEHLMDFDIYQFEKEGMTLKEYAESEADEYKADKVEEVPYVDIQKAPFSALFKDMLFPMIIGSPMNFRGIYSAALESDPQRDEKLIPVQNIEGDILILVGEDDEMMDTLSMAELIKSKSANTVIYSYENAGHMFSGDGIASEFGMRIRLGGTIEGNEKAGAESEKIVEEFLKEHHGK